MSTIFAGPIFRKPSVSSVFSPTPLRPSSPLQPNSPLSSLVRSPLTRAFSRTFFAPRFNSQYSKSFDKHLMPVAIRHGSAPQVPFWSQSHREVSHQRPDCLWNFGRSKWGRLFDSAKFGTCSQRSFVPKTPWVLWISRETLVPEESCDWWVRLWAFCV